MEIKAERVEISNGTYSIVDALNPILNHGTADYDVEGYRQEWESRMMSAAKPSWFNGSPAQKKAFEAGFLAALLQLRNEALPPAFCRSLPIMRFQAKINRIVNAILG